MAFGNAKLNTDIAVLIERPVKSFYLVANPVFYRVCSKIETLATPHGRMDHNMYGRLNLVLNGAFAIQNEAPAIQISSIFSTDNTNFIMYYHICDSILDSVLVVGNFVLATLRGHTIRYWQH